MIILLGIILAGEAVMAAPAGSGALSGRAAVQCCKAGCADCPMPVCCAKPADDQAPRDPVRLPSNSQNDWQPPAASVASLPTPALLPADQLPAPLSPFLRGRPVPIFQRDCSYLI